MSDDSVVVEVLRISDQQMDAKDAQIAKLFAKLLLAHEQIGELKAQLARAEKRR